MSELASKPPSMGQASVMGMMARVRAIALAHREVSFSLLALLAFGAAYVLEFQFVRTETVGQSILAALRNIIPLGVLGILVRQITRHFIIPLPPIVQAGLHAVLAAVFSLTWYLLILVAAGLQQNWALEGFSIEPFYFKAASWQLFQGITVYAAVLGFIYGFYLWEQLDQARRTLQQSTAPLTHAAAQDTEDARMIFVKSAGEYVRLDANEIIHIEAKGDYVVLQTRRGTYSSNRTLKDHLSDLEGAGFIQAHRSHLINLQAVRAAEPTGDGRLSLHLSNGTTIIASRSGSRAFRDKAAGSA
ncbi:MAG: LytTR family DNA-binding domain-containing protein [Pseudomonadota bacterium]